MDDAPTREEVQAALNDLHERTRCQVDSGGALHAATLLRWLRHEQEAAVIASSVQLLEVRIPGDDT